MLSNDSSLAALPRAMLGTIIQSAANRGCYKELAALNLACQATHDALPLAFSSEPPDDDDVFLAQASAADAYPEDDGLPGDDASPGASGPHLTLRLDLDRLGSDAFSGVPPSAVQLATLRNTARRFAQVHSLHVLLKRPMGVLGGHLFAEHATPLMQGVRHLVIQGPTTFSMPPFWLAPQADAFTSRITQLTVTAHHSGLAPLVAHLPTTFPSLTALRLILHTHHSEVESEDGQGEDFTVVVPPALRLLLLRFIYRASELNSFDSTNDVFTLTLDGAQTLRRLGIFATLYEDEDTASDSDSDADAGLLTHPRPVLIVGHQPALRHLTLPWYPLRGGATASLSEGLVQLCPHLSQLVLSPWDWKFGPRECEAFLASLAPLAGSLQVLDIEEMPIGPIAGQVWLGRLVRRWLPTTELRLPGAFVGVAN